MTTLTFIKLVTKVVRNNRHLLVRTNVWSAILKTFSTKQVSRCPIAQWTAPPSRCTASTQLREKALLTQNLTFSTLLVVPHRLKGAKP